MKKSKEERSTQNFLAHLPLSWRANLRQTQFSYRNYKELLITCNQMNLGGKNFKCTEDKICKCVSHGLQASQIDTKSL